MQLPFKAACRLHQCTKSEVDAYEVNFDNKPVICLEADTFKRIHARARTHTRTHTHTHSNYFSLARSPAASLCTNCIPLQEMGLQDSQALGVRADVENSPVYYCNCICSACNCQSSSVHGKRLPHPTHCQRTIVQPMGREHAKLTAL